MTTPDDAWTNCPTGEVGALVRRLRSRSRLRTARRVGVGAFAVIAVGLTLFLAARDPGQPGGGKLIGGVWCSDVIEMAEDYLGGQLDAVVMEQLTAHINGCPHCRQKIDEMRAGALPPPPIEVRGEGRRDSSLAGINWPAGSFAIARR